VRRNAGGAEATTTNAGTVAGKITRRDEPQGTRNWAPRGRRPRPSPGFDRRARPRRAEPCDLSAGHYARQAGVAPIPVASGRNDRVRLNRGGDRQLNCALHTIAITRARICPDTRAYLDRKQAQGKTRPEAYRCLKCHLARHVWHRLRDLPDQPQPRPPRAVTIHCNMPTHALALT
jgi:hypothetical protein